jgi:alpha-tubulin suppressor-like RCC1 family protein
VFCWGSGGYGQLGNGRLGHIPGSYYGSDVPVTVVGLNNAVALSAGERHTCALTRSGTAVCWGDGFYGQLGDGHKGNYNTDYESSVPVAVIGLNNVVAISAGKTHSCALSSIYAVFCWGNGKNRQLDGSTYSSTAPVPLIDLSKHIGNISTVSAGGYQTYVLASSGKVVVWGYTGFSDSEYGQGHSADWVTNLSNAVSVSAGHVHACSLTSTGNVVCWGSGSSGQLGDGKASNSSTPVAVVGLTTPLPIAENVSIEFYHPGLDHYFVTASPEEISAVSSGSAGAWLRTGNSFKAGGTTPVCRFYGSVSPGPNSHFYTGDPGECEYLKSLQAATPENQKRWNYEGISFSSTPPISGACKTGTIPVYRAYNNGASRGIDSNHRISTNKGAIDAVVTRGWKNEGVVMCAPI